jgi:tRNA-dihydrouridine synthase 4
LLFFVFRVSPTSRRVVVDSETVELAQRAEKMGAAWVTVHGRTRSQRSTHPVNFEAVKLVKEHMTVPVFGNGNCFKLADALEWKEKTGVDGVMAARGLLQNPALFAGYDKVPLDCIMEFIDIALQVGLPSHTLHQHLMYMLFEHHNRAGSNVHLAFGRWQLVV